MSKSHMPSSRIPAVFLDWAGTVVDHGSIAPVNALESLFQACGIVAPRPLVRRHMGLAKKDHIRKMLEEVDIRAQWIALHHSAPTERDVEVVFARFQPQMMEALAGYSQVISGVVDAVAEMRARGMKIAGTTGYTRPMLDRLEALAAEQGYRTDRSLAPEDAGGGRPFPWMCYRLGMDLHIYPLHACVKIGDTGSDMAEGRNAGMWTIGVTRTGNSVGLSEEEWSLLSRAEQQTQLDAAGQELRSAGAHYTAESVAHVLPLLEEISQRISRGERPQ
jgi:phosphonoacetaldehyde hydrolase